MKKILISVLIVLLLITVCFAIFKGITFVKIKSINDVKSASNKLEEDTEKAEKLSMQEYPSKVQNLEDAIKNLKLAKQEFENKKPINSDELNIGAVEVKTYKIHYLWTILGNYKKDEGARSLNLDLKATTNKDVYDLQFTLVGSYMSITDFLYDIEDDEELKFQIKDLKITRTDDKVAKTSTTTQASATDGNTTDGNTTNNATTKTTTSDNSEGGTLLKATFTVQNIGITLD